VPWLEARASSALGPAHLFFDAVTVARFGRSGEIAQLIIDYVLRRGQAVSLGRQVKSNHH
jgi:hypothetical protein